MGYLIAMKVMNTKDYGVPQNRERVFIVGFLDADDYHSFSFEDGFELETRLTDVLDTEVNDRYYLSNSRIDKINNSKFTQEKNIIQENICGTLLSRDYKDPKCVQVFNGIRKITQKEYFKLQGVKESCIDLVVSDSQAYKIAGNAISVNVMQSLLRSLYKPVSKKDTLF